MTREHLHATLSLRQLVCFACIPAEVGYRTLVVLGALGTFLTIRLAYGEERPFKLIVAVETLLAISVDVACHVDLVAGADFLLGTVA